MEAATEPTDPCVPAPVNSPGSFEKLECKEVIGEQVDPQESVESPQIVAAGVESVSTSVVGVGNNESEMEVDNAAQVAQDEEQISIAALTVLGATAEKINNLDNEEAMSEEQMIDCSNSLLSLCTTEELDPSQSLPEVTDTKIKMEVAATSEIVEPQLLSRSKKCGRCKKKVFFDDLCRSFDPPIPVPLKYDNKFVINYCPDCKTEEEAQAIHIELLARTWFEIAEIALLNLYDHAEKDKITFGFREEVCPFIAEHWERLCFGKNRKTQWEATLGTTMNSKSEIFGVEKQPTGNLCFLWRKRDSGAPKTSRKRKRPNSKERPGKKQKVPSPTMDEPDGDVSMADPLADPYLYIPLPPKFYSPHEKIPLTMHIEKENSAPQIEIKNNGLTCSNSSGYRMARASWPICDPGVYYFEVSLPRNLKGAVRLGWSTEKGDLQGPVGYDKLSYSYRNRTGQKFWRSRGNPYGEPYGANDVIGCLIKVTDTIEERVLEPILPKVRKKKNEKWAKEAEIFSKKTDDSTPVEIMKDSEIMFFKNGKCQGTAFTDIVNGKYYPAISLFMGGECTVNFGPKFSFRLTSDHKYADICLPVSAVVPAEHPKPEPEPEPIPPPPPIEGLKPITTISPPANMAHLLNPNVETSDKEPQVKNEPEMPSVPNSEPPSDTNSEPPAHDIKPQCSEQKSSFSIASILGPMQ